MNRFLLAIAMTFALAAVSGPSMAQGLASGQFWNVTADVDGWCPEPAEGRGAVPAFKPCAKKINGQAVPCQLAPAVLPQVAICLLGRTGPTHRLGPKTFSSSGLAEGWFRPLRGIGRA